MKGWLGALSLAAVLALALTAVGSAATPFHCLDSSGGVTGYPAKRITVVIGQSRWGYTRCTNADALSEEVGAGVISPNLTRGTPGNGPVEYRFTDNNRQTIWTCWVREGPDAPYDIYVGGQEETAPNGWWDWSCTGSNGAIVKWRGTMDSPRPESSPGPYRPPCSATTYPGEPCVAGR